MEGQKILIDCTNHVAGRLMSKIVGMVKNHQLSVYLINWHAAIFTGSIKNAVAKYKYDVDHSTTTHGPYLPHSLRGLFWRQIRGMYPNNKKRLENIKKKIWLLSPHDYVKLKIKKLKFNYQIAGKPARLGKHYTIETYSRKINGKK